MLTHKIINRIVSILCRELFTGKKMRQSFRYRGRASVMKMFNDTNNQRNFISREYYEQNLYQD